MATVWRFGWLVVLSACMAQTTADAGGIAQQEGALSKSKNMPPGPAGNPHGKHGNHGHGHAYGHCKHEPAPICQPSTGTPAPVDAAQPGESSQCQALGIVACRLRFSGAEGGNAYWCFDANGNQVLYAAASQAATQIPCTQTQLDAWVAAYATPCWRLVPWSNVTPSAIPLVLDASLLPTAVCSNVDRSIYQFDAACSHHTYSIAQTTGGGNFSGTTWTLDIAPPTTDTFLTGYPFLACSSYSASQSCGWHVQVTRDGTHLQLQTDDITSPCREPFLWQDALDKLTDFFTTCTAEYMW
jgi:hypothetical protein